MEVIWRGRSRAPDQTAKGGSSYCGNRGDELHPAEGIPERGDGGRDERREARGEAGSQEGRNGEPRTGREKNRRERKGKKIKGKELWKETMKRKYEES